jgi:hypothetical protein
MNKEIQDLLAKRYGNVLPCERLRAQIAVQEIADIMHPKFDKQAEEDGDSVDDEGYIADYQWSADTLDDICAALYRNGFGPDSRIKYELRCVAYEREKAPEAGVEGGKVTGLTDSEWNALAAWVETARDYSKDFPENTQSTEYWITVLGEIRRHSLMLEDAGNLLEWGESFSEVERHDAEPGPHLLAMAKLGQLIQAKVAETFVTER